MVAWLPILELARLGMKAAEFYAGYRRDGKASETVGDLQARVAQLEDRLEEQAGLFKELVERTEETARAFRQTTRVLAALAGSALVVSLASLVLTVMP